MTDFRPVHVPLPATADDDPRVGHLLGTACTPSTARVAIIGFPCDEGVRRNGGRAGATDGPTALRHALYKLTPGPADELAEILRHTIDLGDVVVKGDLEADQVALAAAVAEQLARGAVPVILGGGHETSYGHFLAYVGSRRKVAILNWDAHPDVRPYDDDRGHSGSPFRQALESPSGACVGYTVAGLNPPSVAAAHVEFLRDYECVGHWNEDLSAKRIEAIFAALSGDTFATFDLDALDQSLAPGVSSPTAGGLSAATWLHAARAAGACEHVRSFDIVELCPPHDVDGRTARMAARTVWELLRGLAAR